MDIVNHQKRGYYWLDDGTTIHGTITISESESHKITAYLQKEKQRAINECDTFIRDNISTPRYTKNKKYFSLGVCATQLVLKKFDSLFTPRSFRYKAQNYAFTIK
jgi:hypothetical protein